MNRYLALVCGLGLLFIILHTDRFTLENAEGQIVLFLPAVGYVLLLISLSVLYCTRQISSLGPKGIWIPLLVIAVSIVLRSIIDPCIESCIEAGIGLLLFGCYLLGRSLGVSIWYLLIPFLLLEVVSILVYSWTASGKMTGGLLAENAYSSAAGIILVVSIFFRFRYQWIIVTIGCIGTFLTGSPQAIIAIVILGLIIIIRQDWGWRLLVTCLILIIVLLPWTILDKGVDKHSKVVRITSDIVEGSLTSEIYIDENNKTVVVGLGKGRIEAWIRAIKNIRPLGHEFDLYRYEVKTGNIVVHNLPLVILDQIGPLAALAWVWVMGYTLFKTRWKYSIIIILVFSLFDHYMWSAYAPFWWILVGIASSSNISSDLIFSRRSNEEVVT